MGFVARLVTSALLQRRGNKGRVISDSDEAFNRPSELHLDFFCWSGLGSGGLP
jgi:hypothetical protein